MSKLADSSANNEFSLLMNCLGLGTEVLVLGSMGFELKVNACEVKRTYEDCSCMEGAPIFASLPSP